MCVTTCIISYVFTYLFMSLEKGSGKNVQDNVSFF